MLTYWTSVINETWGVDVSLTRLDGELDLNLLARAADGSAFVCKVMRLDCERGLIEMQCMAMEHIRQKRADLPISSVRRNLIGDLVTVAKDEQQQDRLIWAIEYLPGHCYAAHLPKNSELAHHLGQQFARINTALKTFKHPLLERAFPWQLLQASEIEADLPQIENTNRRVLLEQICQQFRHQYPVLAELPRQAIHNDLNDYNLLVSAPLSSPATLSGIIDFGDMCSAPRICELAIAGAYLVLDHTDPEAILSQLLAGYHQKSPLSLIELELFYVLLQMRLAVSLVISTKTAKLRPDDPYVTISQSPAWRFLESTIVDETRLLQKLRVACGFAVTETSSRIHAFLNQQRGQFAAVIGLPLDDAETVPLSVRDSSFPQDPNLLTVAEAATMGVNPTDGKPKIGYYREPRLIYSGAQFLAGRWKASERRTVHIGVDVFAPAGTKVHSPLDGVVRFVANQPDRLDYGGLVILEHSTATGDLFHTLYGHLDPDSCSVLAVGQFIAKGSVFARLGDLDKNGGWAPHVHFQLGIGSEILGSDWPGVANPDEQEYWCAVFPNPAPLLNLPNQVIEYCASDQQHILKERHQLFAKNLKLSYQEPLMFLRGYRHYLFDQWGRTFLDAYNNVPHVGHAHPRIQAVASEQLKRMNSNTRYLHPAQTRFAETLLATLPEPFAVCYFVNSGSEANELALRLARAHTGGKDMIAPNHGYHGNTTGAIDVSAYKFNSDGGIGQPDWVHLVDAPDVYRGQYQRNDESAATKYANQVDKAIERVKSRGERLAGFIAETFPSVGGQIIPPVGYFQQVYRKVRAAGGVCIADEVQTGLGRLGEYYYAFEQQAAVPDIVVLGKPIGNGHPMGVVVTSQAIADSFAKGPEFFSTFGGSTLSCVIGHEVLSIVKDEDLQANALASGRHLFKGLQDLQQRHLAIGDVRGMGLFIGVELVSDRDQRIPATDIASYVVNRLREQHVLIGVEGPDNNILKIRPPLTITIEDCEMILFWLDRILSESAIADRSETGSN